MCDPLSNTCPIYIENGGGMWWGGAEPGAHRGGGR